MTPDALALAAVLAQPWADVVLSGAATVDTLRTTWRLWTWNGPSPDAGLAALRENPDEYWERRSALAWN